MAKTTVEIACEPLDAEIARLQAEIKGLERSKELIAWHAARNGEGAEKKTRKPRGPNKRKPGLPAQTDAVQ